MRRAWATILAALVGGSVLAGTMEGRATTWADFSHIITSAASMSHVFFVTTEGVTRYNRLTYKWEDPLTGTEGIDHQDIDRIWVDEFADHLVVRTSLGLFEYDSLFSRWYPIDELPPLENPARHIGETGLLYVPPGFNYFPEGQITDRHGRVFNFTDVLDDRSGTLWLGTWGLGVATAGASTSIVEFLPYGLLQNRVNTMAIDDGEILVGGAAVEAGRTGLTRLDTAGQNFAYLESGLDRRFPDYDINCLALGDTTLYVGTARGLYQFDRDTERLRVSFDRRHGLPDDNILSLTERHDSLWVGTEYGCCLMVPDGDSVTISYPANLASSIIWDIVLIGDEVWLGTSDGAFRLNLGDRRLQRLNAPLTGAGDDIYAIEECDGLLWMLVEDAVLSVERSTGETESFPIYGYRIQPNAMAVCEWALAIGTDQGLSLIFLDKHRTRFEISTSDGLPSNLIYSLAFDGDYLWIGSDRGLTRFDLLDL